MFRFWHLWTQWEPFVWMHMVTWPQPVLAEEWLWNIRAGWGRSVCLFSFVFTHLQGEIRTSCMMMSCQWQWFVLPSGCVSWDSVGDMYTTCVMDLLPVSCFTYIAGCDVWVWMLGDQWNRSYTGNCGMHIWLWGVPCTYHACSWSGCWGSKKWMSCNSTSQCHENKVLGWGFKMWNINFKHS